MLTAAGCQITVNTYFCSTRFSSDTSASLCRGVMEGLLTRCRALPALATCSHQLSQRFHHCAPGRGKRLVLSRMFQPQKLREDQVLSLEGRSGDLTCKSQQLMLQVGLIHPASPGCYHLLPYTVRAMEKLVRVIDQEMQIIGGQKVNMPSLSPAELWRATNRWDSMARCRIQRARATVIPRPLYAREASSPCLGRETSRPIWRMALFRGWESLW